MQHLLTASDLVRSHTERFEMSGLERYDRPLPQMHEYDALLEASAEVTR